MVMWKLKRRNEEDQKGGDVGKMTRASDRMKVDQKNDDANDDLCH